MWREKREADTAGGHLGFKVTRASKAGGPWPLRSGWFQESVQTQKPFSNRHDLRIGWTAGREAAGSPCSVKAGKSQGAWTAVEAWPAEFAQIECSEGQY